MIVTNLPEEKGQQVVNVIFRTGRKIDAIIANGHAHQSEDGQYVMVVLDIDDEMVEAIRRTMLRMKAKNAPEENARELSDIADAA